MSKFMSFETFKDCYIGAIASGVAMNCVFWNDDGEQVNISWNPYTLDMHNQVKYEAEMIVEEKGIDECDDDYEEALNDAIDEVIESYKTEIDEAARFEYQEYIGENDKFDFLGGEWYEDDHDERH